MKFLIVLMFMIPTAFAGDYFKVVSVLKDVTRDYKLTIKANTYISNIQGYSCAWPGIRDELLFSNFAELKHGTHFFNRNALGIKYDDLDQQFCDRPSAEEVFGPEFLIGAILPLKVRILKEVVETPSVIPSSKQRYIRETISTRIWSRNLQSVALVLFESAQESDHE